MAVCTVTTILVDATETPLEGVIIDFYAHGPQGVGTTNTMITERVRRTSDASGNISIDLLQSSQVRLVSPRLNLKDLVIDVPASSSADLSTLIEAALA